MAEVTVKNKSFFIPDKGSPCELWRTYFNRLKKEVGTNHARMIWLVTWKKNGSSTCTTNAAFNKWLKQNKMDVSSASTRAIADISSIGGSILGLGKNLTKVLSIGVPVLLGGGVLLVGYFLFKASKDGDVSQLATLTPQGRAVTALNTLKK